MKQLIVSKTGMILSSRILCNTERAPADANENTSCSLQLILKINFRNLF